MTRPIYTDPRGHPHRGYVVEADEPVELEPEPEIPPVDLVLNDAVEAAMGMD